MSCEFEMKDMVSLSLCLMPTYGPGLRDTQMMERAYVCCSLDVVFQQPKLKSDLYFMSNDELYELQTAPQILAEEL
jgi:hypothetical protein